MNLNEQYLACAELDGLKDRHYYKCSDPWDGDCDICGGKAPSSKHDWPDYDTRDALVAVIEKQPDEVVDNVILQILMLNQDENKPRTANRRLLLATPAQLREALLRATGKWKE